MISILMCFKLIHEAHSPDIINEIFIFKQRILISCGMEEANDPVNKFSIFALPQLRDKSPWSKLNLNIFNYLCAKGVSQLKNSAELHSLLFAEISTMKLFISFQVLLSVLLQKDLWFYRIFLARCQLLRKQCNNPPLEFYEHHYVVVKFFVIKL